MKARIIHWCIHVLDKEASIAFYERALGFHVAHEMGPDDGSWSNTYLVNDQSPFEIELTWNRGRTEPYANGGRDTHIAFAVDDMEAARKLHEDMGCIVFDNPRMGIYFIADPDGSWIEIIPGDFSFGEGATSACTSASSGRRPSRVTVTQVPGTGSVWVVVNRPDGSVTSTMPVSLISKQPTSSAGP